MSPPACSGRKDRFATVPRSAPERRGDAAAQRPYLAKPIPCVPPTGSGCLENGAKWFVRRENVFGETPKTAGATPGETPALPISTECCRLSTPFHKYDHVCGEGFSAQTRRERRAYPSGVCKARATTSGPKRTAARRVASLFGSGVVAPRSSRQVGTGDAPSSRLARTEKRRNKRGRIYEMEYLAWKPHGR